MIESYFSSISEFLKMGHYAQYVWPAYAVVLVVLVLKQRISARQNKRLLKMLKKEYANK